MNRLLILTIVLIISQSLHAQKKMRWLREIFNPPHKVEAVDPLLDTTDVLVQDSTDMHFGHHHHFDFDEHHDSIANNDEILANQDPIKNTDTTSVYQIENSSKEYWVSVDTNFAIFDSMNVNPYRYDAMKLKDTLPMVLFNSERSWSMPLSGKHHKTSVFGPRGYSFHYGTDIRLSIGDSVFACYDGIIRIAKYNKGGYGNYVMVRHHNGLESLYGHLSKRLVNVGQEVKAGDLIGFGGNTGRSSGPHLHFEVRHRGVAFNPESVFDFTTQELRNSTLMLNPDHFKYIKIQKQKVYHRVRKGDTLYAIARRYRVRSSQICRLSHITTRSTLRIGQKLRIK